MYIIKFHLDIRIITVAGDVLPAIMVCLASFYIIHVGNDTSVIIVDFYTHFCQTPLYYLFP